ALSLLLPLRSLGKMSYYHFNCGLWFNLTEAPGVVHPLGISDRSMAGGLIFVSRLRPVTCLQHLELGHYRSSDHQSSRLNTRRRISKRYLMNMPQEVRVTIEIGDFRKPVQLLSCVAKALYYGHARGISDERLH